MDAIRGHIQSDIQADGGTNLDAGLDDATDLLAEYETADQSTYENRMIVLTDAMPNVGTTSDDGLRERLASAADRNLHATFVGVGLDFNTEIVDEITSVPGANYYSVHSPSEFESRVVDGFAYMVTPLVFDLSLELDADGYAIEQVYGSTAADEATGELMHVNTLFASPTSDGETRGGVVLAKITETTDSDATDTADATDAGASGELTLRASWTDRTGADGSRETTIEFPAGGPDQYANTGVRKAVALARYADCLKNWMIAERTNGGDPPSDGIAVPDQEDHLGEWERQSDPLRVSGEYRDRFRLLADYLEAEMHAVDDDTLQQELDLLDTLATYGERDQLAATLSGQA
jgi:Ca-activated chloride channel family protein